MAVTNEEDCPFCQIDSKRIIHQNLYGFSVRDGFPVSQGHSLVIPKRHTGSFFDLSKAEQHALLELLEQCKTDLCRIEGRQEISAFNIGINDGTAAGQTVPHCHIHLIPRYEGDVKDPRGGVRWVIPEKADYWSKRS